VLRQPVYEEDRAHRSGAAVFRRTRFKAPAPFGSAYKAKRRGLGPSAIFVSPPLQFKRNRRGGEAFYRQNRNLDVTVCSCVPH
jgi:hypothetical protein